MKLRGSNIHRLDYSPGRVGDHGVEIFSVSDLRARVSAGMMRATHRYAFHMLVCVTQGTCRQQVDFEEVECHSRSILLIHAGQAHNFGVDKGWDGWLVLFREEFLPSPLLSCAGVEGMSSIEELAGLYHPGDGDRIAFFEAVRLLHRDISIDAPFLHLQALLRHELCAFLLRLGILRIGQDVSDDVPAGTFRRFVEFRRLLDVHFREWQRVSDYARQIGCSEKSLTRATQDVQGIAAKAFITGRVMLEAKRLLAHTRMTVAEIGKDLAFEEASNFVKVFKRETGVTPAEFRRRQQGMQIQEVAGSG